MEKENISPYASFLEYSEEMYLMLDNIKTLIIYGFGFVILILLFIADGYFKLNYFLNNLQIFGIIAGILAFIVIYYSIPVYKDISKWEKNYLNSSYFLNFSLLPLEGKYLGDQLLVKILDVFARYKNITSKYSWDMVVDKFTDITAIGNTKEHSFDVLIAGIRSDDDDDKDTRKMMEELKDKGYIVAKIFDKVEPVTSSDLDEYRSNILDATTHHGAKKVFLQEKNPFRIIAVSPSSFSDDAVEYAKNKKNWIKRVSYDLIEQKNDMYNIIWIS